MKMEINFVPESTEFSINLKEDGNSVIICTGLLAGRNFLPEEDKELMVRSLQSMVSLWNNYYGN